MLVSIGKAAAFLGVCITTLRRWHDSGVLVPDYVTSGGHRRYSHNQLKSTLGYHVLESNATKTIAYARVSSHDQKKDLITQTNRLRVECSQRGWDFDIIKDLGSGMNYNKHGFRRLIKLIHERKINRLVLVNKDRLLRFGAEIVFMLCEMYDVEVVILDHETQTFEQRLVADVIEVMTVFSSRMYGSRSHKNKKILATK